MSNGVLKIIIYFALFIVESLLKILYFAFDSVKYILTYILTTLLYEMSEPKIRRKTRKVDGNKSSTVVNRGIINANWQNFLAKNLIMDTKVDKAADKTHFTGTFRRARKKNSDGEKTVQHNLKTLEISSDSNKIVQNSVQDSKNNLKTLEITSDCKKIPLNSVQERKEDKKNKLTKFLAMDCEMVGIGWDGSDHMLARVSLVNKFGDCIYDKFVRPREEVKDFRTNISGIRKEDLLNGETFAVVQKEVAELIRGRILVGHSLKNDLSVLFLSHPKRSIRDTSRYKPFRMITKGSTPSLKRLAKEILGIDIQSGEHSSVEDARAVMQLYCTVAKKWEAMLREKRGHSRIDE